jgi:Glycosyl transferase family 2
MLEWSPHSSTVNPLFTIVIGVRNDWAPLGECLGSLALQTSAPPFEVIVIDDGSKETAPESIQKWASAYPLKLMRQEQAGISVARNHGIEISRGPILLFTDADCKFLPACLQMLALTIAQSPHKCFQLHLVGNGIGSVGRAEELRLMTLQDHFLQPDGCIRYLNTAAFAIRREAIPNHHKLFDPAAARAEDTLLLARLIKNAELPFFVESAIVEHSVKLPLLSCLRKDFRSAYLEAKAYAFIASRGIRIQVRHRERISMLRSMWKISTRPSIGRSAWWVLVGRQGLRLLVFVIYRCLPLKPKLETSL